MGVIARVAGTGTQGNTGDDGPATDAELSFPAGVAVTADGGFLVADTENNVVRAVSRRRVPPAAGLCTMSRPPKVGRRRRVVPLVDPSGPGLGGRPVQDVALHGWAVAADGQ